MAIMHPPECYLEITSIAVNSLWKKLPALPSVCLCIWGSQWMSLLEAKPLDQPLKLQASSGSRGTGRQNLQKTGNACKRWV